MIEKSHADLKENNKKKIESFQSSAFLEEKNKNLCEKVLTETKNVIIIYFLKLNRIK
jgi:hypothetical protein